MAYKKSITILGDFLSSESYSGEFNIDQLLGIIVSTLSCSESVSDAEIAELVMGEFEEGFQKWFDDGKLRTAWVDVYNELTEQLTLETFDLKKHYPLAKDATAPTSALSDWCDGYLHGYLLTEDIWLDDFDLLMDDPELESMQSVVDECEASLNLIATFASWQNALNDAKSIERLERGVSEIYQGIIEGVEIRSKLASIIEDEKMEYADFDDEELTEEEEAEFLTQIDTFYRETPKIGRNDPCFCGSGKKYKKCCLN
jgi:yecA family protein